MTKRNILWESKDLCEGSNIRKYTDWVNNTYDKRFESYEDLRRWSIENISDFWESILRYFNVRSEGNYSQVLNSEMMPGNRWFNGLKLNYAENNLYLGEQDEIAMFFNETAEGKSVSREEFQGKAGL